MCVGVVSQVWGAGTRLGIYRMSPQRAYWYVTYNSGPTIAPTEKQGDHLLQRYVPSTSLSFCLCTPVEPCGMLGWSSADCSETLPLSNA